MTLCNEKEEILGHAAFFDYPNIPNVDPAKWEEWMADNYNGAKCTALNTLFMHYLCRQEGILAWLCKGDYSYGFQRHSRSALSFPGCTNGNISRSVIVSYTVNMDFLRVGKFCIFCDYAFIVKISPTRKLHHDTGTCTMYEGLSSLNCENCNYT